MPDTPQQPPLPYDVNFEITETGYNVWFSDRIADGHPDLVDECGQWMEDEVGALNLGQIDHRVLLADGVLTDTMVEGLIAWWRDHLDDLRQG
jgi:hypothetical protein